MYSIFFLYYVLTIAHGFRKIGLSFLNAGQLKLQIGVMELQLAWANRAASEQDEKPCSLLEKGQSFFWCLISRSYFSAPIHSFAAGHHSMQVGLISRVMVFLHPLHSISTSSDHISDILSHQKHVISSGYGVLISLLPGQPSFKDIFISYTLVTVS